MTDSDDAAELRRLLDDLAAMRLRPAEWVEIEEQLRTVEPSGRASVERVSQVVFEARVQRRFQAGRATSTLPPTKQTSALPWVGLVCGALLLAVGGALGGGPVLIGVALLGVFVFGIAMAGSRVTHSRGPATPASPDEPPCAHTALGGGGDGAAPLNAPFWHHDSRSATGNRGSRWGGVGVSPGCRP